MRCQEKNNAKCYHHDVCDSTTLECLLEDLENSMVGYMDKYGKENAEILSKTELLDDPMMATKFTCNRHIDYIIPDDNDQAANEYVSFIVRECRIRGIRIKLTTRWMIGGINFA
jgi:hypothetical protein